MKQFHRSFLFALVLMAFSNFVPSFSFLFFSSSFALTEPQSDSMAPTPHNDSQPPHFNYQCPEGYAPGPFRGGYTISDPKKNRRFQRTYLNNRIELHLNQVCRWRGISAGGSPSLFLEIVLKDHQLGIEETFYHSNTDGRYRYQQSHHNDQDQLIFQLPEATYIISYDNVLIRPNLARVVKIPYTFPGEGKDFRTSLSTPHQLLQLAQDQEIPGFSKVKTVKFLYDIGRDKVIFINTALHFYHYDFAQKVMGLPVSLAEFERFTYREISQRALVAGSVLIYDHVKLPDYQGVVMTMEFFPGDPVQKEAALIGKIYRKIRQNKIFQTSSTLPSPFPPTPDQRLFYLANGVDHQSNGNIGDDSFKQLLHQQGVDHVMTSVELYQGVEHLVMNEGEAVGYLVYLTEKDVEEESSAYLGLNEKSLPVFEGLPLDLNVTAGIITQENQTPLSHINIKSKARGTPNLVLKGAFEKLKQQGLLGELVHLKLVKGQYFIKKISLEEAQKFWRRKGRKSLPGDLKADLKSARAQKILSCSDLRFADAAIVGSKAANYAELRRVFLRQDSNFEGRLRLRVENPEEQEVRHCLGIPFSFYQTFLQENGLQDDIDLFLKESSGLSSLERIERLKILRKQIEKAPFETPKLQKFLADLKKQIEVNFAAGTKLKLRSSTNAEDLLGFNGAGLYSSKAYHPGSEEKTLEKALRDVWASVWNERAYAEREFYQMNHRQVMMGILVSPSFPEEDANGVAITQNIYNPQYTGFTLNLQKGENSVTNPLPHEKPEQILVLKNYLDVDSHGNMEDPYLFHTISSSNLSSTPILDKEILVELVKLLEKAHVYFKGFFDPRNQMPDFALDIEFKVLHGKIYFKQARPYVK